MKRTYLYKLYHSPKNSYLHELIDISAEIYNHCIALYKGYFKLFKKYPHKFKVMTHITKLKHKPEYEHWKRVPAQSIQNIPERINEAYQLFFRYKNTLKRPPSFCKKENYTSFTLKQSGYKVTGNTIRIVDEVFKFHKSREIQGKIKTVTIKRDRLRDIYIAFSCDIPSEDPQPNITGKTAGFEFGLKNFITSSDGLVVKSPQFFRRAITIIKRANRRLTATTKDSRNHELRRLHLARVHKKIFNQRKDFQVKLARDLAQKYRYLIFEDLNINKMKSEKNLGRKLNDLGFSNFILYLKNFASQYGSEVIFIDRNTDNSKKCHYCLKVNDNLLPRDKVWTCDNCNVTHDRDVNTAMNIKITGQDYIDDKARNKS